MMQLNPIFPFHVSKSRMTPTLTGIVVFRALAKKLLSERMMKKREKAILVGICMIMFNILEALKFMVLSQNCSYL